MSTGTKQLSPNLRISTRTVTIVDTPSGIDLSKVTWRVKVDDDPSKPIVFSEIVYVDNDKELPIFIQIRNPSMTFDNYGERIFIQLTDRQLGEWKNFFEHVESQCAEQTGWEYDEYHTPCRDLLSVKIVKPGTWMPDENAATISFLLGGWQFSKGDVIKAGANLATFPPKKSSTSASSRKRVRKSSGDFDSLAKADAPVDAMEEAPSEK